MSKEKDTGKKSSKKDKKKKQKKRKSLVEPDLEEPVKKQQKTATPTIAAPDPTDDTTTERPQPGEEGFAKLEAMEYLQLWDTDRVQWKFNKNRQVWLLQKMFHPSSVDRHAFKILLKYLEGMNGAARQTTLAQAQAILEEGVGVQTTGGPAAVEGNGVHSAVVEKQKKATEKLRRIRFGRADALARILA
jgi:hypothetical protein